MQQIRIGWSAASRKQKSAIVVAGIIGLGALAALVSPEAPAPTATPLGA